jgi:hypothetical protein
MFDQQSYMREYRKVYMPKYRISNIEKFRGYDKKRSCEAKLGAFNVLGGSICFNCGETGIEFLTLGHINNDGNRKRQTDHCGTSYFYHKLLNNEMNRSLYQILCWNCNFSKYLGEGECIHQRRIGQVG